MTLLLIVLGGVLYFGIENKTYKPLQIFILLLAIICFVIMGLSAMLGMIFLIVAPISIISCVYYLILYFIARTFAKKEFSPKKFIVLTVVIFAPILLFSVAESLPTLFFGPLDMK